MSAAGTIFAKELRELLRDRRAVFFAFIVPLFLYPLLFLCLSALPRAHLDELEARPLVVGVRGDASFLPPSILGGAALEMRSVDGDPEDLLRAGEVSASLDLDRAPGGDYRRGATIHYLASSASSQEARQRLLTVLEELSAALVEERFRAAGLAVEVDRVLPVEVHDTATSEERSAAVLGRLLPFLLVLLLLTGGSFAALDLVAGEKERGTIETLVVQAVSRRSIVLGKFLLVLFASLSAVTFNLLGLLGAAWLGIPAYGLQGEPLLLPGPSAALSVLVLLVPLGVLSSAVLLGLSAVARSYREAQTYLLPLTLLSLLPVGFAISPQVELSGIVPLVPVTNVAVAIRSAVAGEFHPPALLVVLGSTAVYAVLVLRWVVALLEREETLLGLEPPPLSGDATRATRERRALVFGAGMLLAVYFAGSYLQSGRIVPVGVGLVLTLWGVVLVPALLYPRFTRQEPRALLGLRPTRGENLVLAAVMAVSASVLVAAYMELQEQVLPIPSELKRALSGLFEGRGAVERFLLLAVSPAICEELLWRGAFQGELEARCRPFRTVVLVGLFFGIFHMDVYRFVPTAVLGGVLATLRERTGSILPSMMFHLTYNAAGLFVIREYLEGGGGSLLDLPLGLVGAVGIFAAAMAALRR